MAFVSLYGKTDSPGYLSENKPALLIANVSCIIVAGQEYSLSFYSADERAR